MTETRDLIADGRNVIVSSLSLEIVRCNEFDLQVTDDNKTDYIKLVCQMKMTGAIRKQLGAFLEGFYDIIPRR